MTLADPDFQHRSSRRYQIHQDDRSAASPSLLVVLCVLPDTPTRVSSFHTDCAGNPLQPTSTGNSHTLHPLSLQSAMRSAYLRLFLSCASSQFSSHGTVSSIATNVFDCWDTSTASGLRLVSTMLVKTGFLSRSTLCSQSCPLSNTDFRLGALLSAVASPCLTNWICTGFWSVGCIYPESKVLGNLIERAPLSLSCHTACSLGLRLDPTDAGLQEKGVCHTLTSAGTRS